jgi:hypothetical protein
LTAAAPIATPSATEIKVDMTTEITVCMASV